MVLDPKGNIVAEDFSGGDKLLVADLDPGVINTIRNKHSRSMRHIYYLGARRPELYGDLTKE